MYTIDLLIADEAAFIPDAVWTAVTPMLAITRGKIILLSTPHGKEGYYYRCFEDKSYTKFHESSEDCVRNDVEFLKREKERMTKAQYAQEYLGEFCEELMQFFPTELIKKCMKAKRTAPSLGRTYYIGVDVAGMEKMKLQNYIDISQRGECTESQKIRIEELNKTIIKYEMEKEALLKKLDPTR